MFKPKSNNGKARKRQSGLEVGYKVEVIQKVDDGTKNAWVWEGANVNLHDGLDEVSHSTQDVTDGARQGFGLGDEEEEVGRYSGEMRGLSLGSQVGRDQRWSLRLPNFSMSSPV